MCDDVHVPNRWHLWNPIDQDGRKIQGWLFCKGQAVEWHGRLRIPIQYPGRALDCTIIYPEVPLVMRAARDLLQDVAGGDIQLFPAEVEAEPKVSCTLVNIAHSIKCLDEDKSNIMRWTEADGRPEKVGDYRMITKMVVDANKCGDRHHIFRLGGWHVAIMVSDLLKEAFEREKVLGVKFQAV
jgi:hypothetical protein